MKIKVTSVYVDDQEKLYDFSRKVLCFTKKADFRQRPVPLAHRGSGRDPDGTELQLALN